MGNEPLTTDLLKRVVADAIAEATTLNRLAYSEPEAASLLGCRPHVLRDARLRGEIRSTKVGKRIGYTRQQLDAYLESQAV